MHDLVRRHEQLLRFNVIPKVTMMNQRRLHYAEFGIMQIIPKI